MSEELNPGVVVLTFHQQFIMCLDSGVHPRDHQC